MAVPVFVQGTGNQNSGTTVVKAFASNVTAGNLLVVAVGLWQQTAGTGAVTDSQGNSYTRRAYIENSGPGIHTHCGIWTAVAGSTGACTVTVTPDASDDMAMAIAEFSGQHATPVESTTTAQGITSGAPEDMLAGSVTATDDAMLVFAANWISDRTSEPKTGWTQIYEFETWNPNTIRMDYKAAAVGANDCVGVITSGTGVDWTAAGISIAAAAGGGGGGSLAMFVN